MTKYTHDIIIIGGGAAGLTAASGMAQLGMKTGLIERRQMGGDCLYFGCVPSKSLLRTAAIYQNAKNFIQYGLPSIELPKPEGGKVMERVKSVIQEIAYHDSPERFRSLGVDVHLTSPIFISPYEIKLETGEVLTAKRIIISTGSSPMFIQIPGLKETGYITNKEIFSLKKIPDHLIVIGAGPIGTEMGQAMRRLGAKVTVIDKALHVLIREDEDMAGIVEKRLIEEGIQLKMNASIERFEKKGRKKKVFFKVDGREESVTGDEILLALGRVGNTENLGLEDIGVETVRSFIKVNDKLQTSQKHILACGDVNGNYMFTHIAGAEGSFAVKRLGLKLPGKMDYSVIPWSTYTDPELASVGYNEKRAKAARIEYRVITSQFNEVDRAHAEGEIHGQIKILIDKKDRVIGTQIASLHAGELLTPSLFAVKNKWKLISTMGPIYPYPTMGEIHRKAASGYFGPKLFNNKNRKILKFLFGYRGKTTG